jgi:predicted DNA-binding WGR domain protein
MILHLEQRRRDQNRRDQNRRDQNRRDQNRRDQNRFRFYALDVCQDLFGAWCLWRRWGRIGTNGRTRVDSYGSEAAAVAAATDLTLRC